ncbi:MAG: tRNA threonylcarbamoyladenosine dehydratase [Spirochaetaceae bacterium]|jgi:tRNA A37 threonylcarbamoyladenosine dehydratase|nr:tRNA threonylcarbamoyladenosine dehydratase [Spirochaetaceae bacterium]
MVRGEFQRLALLMGESAIERLAKIRVLIVGIGGVGSWCAEALVRSGVGNIALLDSDTICITNINRQVEALQSNVGEFKTEALAKRLKEINRNCNITIYNEVFSKETAPHFDIEHTDYVIDAIDSIQYKLDLIEYCQGKTTLFSSMGTACKLDPSQLRTGDIWETEGCPLARMVRAGLRKRGFLGRFVCVYSKEIIEKRNDIEVSCGTDKCLCCKAHIPGATETSIEWCSKKAVINGSCVTVTATAGMILASLVLRDIQ